MILAGRYEQLEPLAEAAIPVHRGRDTVSGKSVYLHRLVPGSAQVAEALKLALQYSLKFPGNGVVLDLIEAPDGIYVVTDGKPEHADLLDFLLTELTSGKTVTPPAPVITPRPVQRPAHAPVVDPSSPGEFTRLFQPAAAPAPHALAPSFANSGLSKRGLAGDAPSEFTKKFNAVRQADPVGRPLGTVPSQEPEESSGEFTRMFNAGRSIKPESPHPREGPRVLPSSQASEQPGEYTSLFGTAGPLAPSARDSGASFLNERPPAAASAHLKAGPSDYTAVVKGGKMPVAPSPATANEREPALSPPPMPAVALPELKAPVVKAPELPKAQLKPTAISSTLLLIAIVLVTAMALIVFFVLRR
jgi:hypothetical protein